MLYETAYEGRKHILWQLLEKEERVEASGGEGEVWETPPSGEEANRDGEGEKSEEEDFFQLPYVVLWLEA